MAPKHRNSRRMMGAKTLLHKTSGMYADAALWHCPAIGTNPNAVLPVLRKIRWLEGRRQTVGLWTSREDADGEYRRVNTCTGVSGGSGWSLKTRLDSGALGHYLG